VIEEAVLMSGHQAYGLGQAYGLWSLVVLNTGLFVLFAASFFHPRAWRDWRATGAFSAFPVALFAEMYEVPLTVYRLSSTLGSRLPALQATHSGGHLWNDLVGWDGDPRLSPFHLASYLAIGGGFWLISAAWQVLWEATHTGRLATTGPYARRHPQCTGFLAGQRMNRHTATEAGGPSSRPARRRLEV
jgi:hypothetical protein